MAKIRLMNMMFYGFHGTYEYEREIGQKFYFDVEVATKNDDLICDDDSDDGIHSTSIYGVVKEAVENKRFRHMRSLAGHIADTLLKDFTNAAEVTVKARKANATIAGQLDYIEVEVTRRSE